MSITYNDIISILCNNNNNKFSTQLNIMKFVDQFSCFKNIFTNEFYRYGIHIYDNEYKNISFLSSVLYCIDDNYNYIDKTILFDKIKEISNNLENIFDIVNKLNVNIIVFDFKNEKIKTIYDGDYFNPYKETIFLANYEKYWEPICCKEHKLFNITLSKCNILKNKILNSDIIYIDNTKIYVLNDNLNEILEDKFGIIESNDESFTTKNTIYSNLTKNKLNKMNKNDILQIIDDLNIEISSLKKPTKTTLIELILNN
tara:strand:+ start:4062 stop:4832 length:771 start_codon:yes stop_codon:yes gene_type:complete